MDWVAFDLVAFSTNQIRAFKVHRIECIENDAGKTVILFYGKYPFRLERINLYAELTLRRQYETTLSRNVSGFEDNTRQGCLVPKRKCYFLKMKNIFWFSDSEHSNLLSSKHSPQNLSPELCEILDWMFIILNNRPHTW